MHHATGGVLNWHHVLVKNIAVHLVEKLPMLVYYYRGYSAKWSWSRKKSRATNVARL
jgi:hypothetical protein